MSEKHDVIIIGAGVIGCSIAYHLAWKGISSSIIERESIGSRASGKAWARVIYPPYRLAVERFPDSVWAMPKGETMARWRDLFWSTYHRMANLAQDIKEKGKIDIELAITPCTLLATSKDSEERIRQSMSYLKENGYHEHEWLESREIKAIFPDINPKIRGGLSVPQLLVEPYKYTLGLAQASEAMGAQIRHGDVVGFETKAGRISAVKLASGTIVEADAVIIAMGPWSGKATSLLGPEVPVHVAITECLRVRVPGGFPPHSLEGDVEIISRVDGEVILASADVKSKAQYFHTRTRHNFDDSLSEEVKVKNIEAALDLLPAFEKAELIEHRGDLLAYGPNPSYHRPVLGRLSEWENGYVATRFGALGIAMSVGAGEIMADLIADGQAPFTGKKMIEYLSPD